MTYCGSCGAQMADGATVCPSCGMAATTQTSSSAQLPRSQNGQNNILGALAYFTIIPPIIFLLVDPFKRNPFIRFHSVQSLLFSLAWFVLSLGLHVVMNIPVFGWLTVLAYPLFALAAFIAWLVVVIKAFSGYEFRLPLIGDFAAQQAAA